MYWLFNCIILDNTLGYSLYFRLFIFNWLLKSLVVSVVVWNIKVDSWIAEHLYKEEVLVDIIFRIFLFGGSFVDIICLLADKLFKFFEVFGKKSIIKLDGLPLLGGFKQKIIQFLYHQHRSLMNTKRITRVSLELSSSHFLQK